MPEKLDCLQQRNRWRKNISKNSCTKKPFFKEAVTVVVFFLPSLVNAFLLVQAQCNKDGFILTGSSGSFSSPNYPSNYPNSRTCRWIIGVQQGHRVQLTFQTFLLETCVTSVCTCDHVEIRDGSDGSSPSLGRFCSDNKPSPIQSSGRFLWIEFDSDLTTNEKGFSATYVAVGMIINFP